MQVAIVQFNANGMTGTVVVKKPSDKQRNGTTVQEAATWFDRNDGADCLQQK
jgi:hypothetical protein